MELVMPSSYVTMEEEEMMYLEGGGSTTKKETAAKIRTRLSTIISASIAGTASAALLAAFGFIGGIVIGAIGGAWHLNNRSLASSAHSKVQGWINKYGTSKTVTMTTTWNIVGWVTGLSVKI